MIWPTGLGPIGSVTTPSGRVSKQLTSCQPPMNELKASSLVIRPLLYLIASKPPPDDMRRPAAAIRLERKPIAVEGEAALLIGSDHRAVPGGGDVMGDDAARRIDGEGSEIAVIGQGAGIVR